MKLVMRYYIYESGEYISRPVEYQSLKLLAAGFELNATIARDRYKTSQTQSKTFTFGGHRFDFTDFFRFNTYEKPDFYTLEEWYDAFKGDA